MTPPIGGVRSGLYGAEVSAIPDNSMFQDPIYQFWGGLIDSSDGESPVDYPEGLAGLADASAVGSPTYRADQNGFAAVEYDPDDGDDDGHDWTPDSQLPTGGSAVSGVMLVYLDSSQDHALLSWGSSNSGEGFHFGVDSNNNPILALFGLSNTFGSTSASTGQWITLGFTLSDGSTEIYLNGVSDATGSQSVNIQDDNHSIGYRRPIGDLHSDAFIAELIICAGDESEQAFSDYHSNRLG